MSEWNIGDYFRRFGYIYQIKRISRGKKLLFPLGRNSVYYSVYDYDIAEEVHLLEEEMKFSHKLSEAEFVQYLMEQ